MKKSIYEITIEDLWGTWISEGKEASEQFTISERYKQYNTQYVSIEKNEAIYGFHAKLNLLQLGNGELPQLIVESIIENPIHNQKDPIIIWEYSGDNVLLEFSDGSKVDFKKIR
ncbi:hypothetical protein [Sinomicrobium sp. M5D2P9]